MKIFDDCDPMNALWSIVSPISKEIPIYRQLMDEDIDSIPQSYLLIRTQVDSATIYGDGVAYLRKIFADVILVTQSTATRSDDLHNVNKRKVQRLLDASGVSYSGYDLGYDRELKQSQYTWSVVFAYG